MHRLICRGITASLKKRAVARVDQVLKQGIKAGVAVPTAGRGRGTAGGSQRLFRSIFRHLLNGWKGERLWPPAPLLMAVDASEKAWGAHTPGGEISKPIIIPFSDEYRARMLKNNFCSTQREVLGVYYTMLVLLEKYPQLVRGNTVR